MADPEILERVPLYPDTPLYSMRVTLSGREFLLQFDYNGRQDRWFFHLSTGDGTRVASGMKVVSNWDVLRKCVHPLRPKGHLFFFDTTRDDAEPPGFSDLGRRVTLWYYVPADPIPGSGTLVVPS